MMHSFSVFFFFCFYFSEASSNGIPRLTISIFGTQLVITTPEQIFEEMFDSNRPATAIPLMTESSLKDFVARFNAEREQSLKRRRPDEVSGCERLLTCSISPFFPFFSYADHEKLSVNFVSAYDQLCW